MKDVGWYSKWWKLHGKVLYCKERQGGHPNPIRKVLKLNWELEQGWCGDWQQKWGDLRQRDELWGDGDETGEKPETICKSRKQGCGGALKWED